MTAVVAATRALEKMAYEGNLAEAPATFAEARRHYACVQQFLENQLCQEPHP